MYPTHFGLKRRLFDGGIAQDAAVFQNRAHELIAANFKVALLSPDAVITVSGPAGVGKTTLASAALRSSNTRLALAWLNGTPTNATELLELLLVELGLNAHRATRIERLQMWRQFLNEMNATESRLFIVVERTEDLDHAVLRALDSLTAADANGCPGANVVLLGQRGLDEFLATPALDSLRQRIRLRQRLEAFTAAELTEYLRHHVARAGGELERLFAPGTLDAIHRYSEGVARIVNNLCETALGLAAAEGHARLTPELVNRAATELLGLASRAVTASAPARVTETLAPAAPKIDAAAPTVTPASEPPVQVAPTVTPPATTTASAAAITATAAGVAPASPAPVNSAAAPPATTTPTPVTAAPVVTPAAAARPSPAAPSRAPAPVMPKPVPVDAHTTTTTDFDGTATDIPDVSLADFPVLTDAVEDIVTPPPPPPPPAATSRPAAETRSTPPARPSAPVARSAAATAARGTAVPAAATPAAATPNRVDTAYAKRPAAAPAKAAAPAPAAPPKAAAPPPAAPPPPAAQAATEDADADELRQTQTMRAISVAKSIDDISNSMAETLFNDADLDMLSAALASAGWSDSETGADAPAAREDKKPAPAAASRPSTSSVDDSFDLFDLGDDAPLELVNDSTQPPRKVGSRR